MPVLADLISAAHQAHPDCAVQDVVVGLYWTGVICRKMGLAMTQSGPGCHADVQVSPDGRWAQNTAYHLLECLHSANPLEASLGLATLNALLPVHDVPDREVNARDLLIREGQGRNVVLVGHFAFTEAIRQSAGRLSVLELQPGPGDAPAEQAPLILPQADVIGLTGSTLSNHTFEGLLPLFPPQALVVMLGPSTPLSPVLFDYRVDVLAGSVVDDAGGISRLIGQASTLHRVPGLRRCTLVRDPSRFRSLEK